LFRLVTTISPAAGSSARTCLSLAASSARIATGLAVVRDRNSAAA
jgi:hypothetical protein